MPAFIPKLHTPYKNLLPPLTEEEELALEADIEGRGLLQPVLIDESNNVLDGHHRYGICCRLGVHCSTTVIAGLESDLEKRLFVLQSNGKRRNLDQAAQNQICQQQIEIYGQLRQHDPKKWTLDKIAKQCGVDRSTVGKWFSNETCPIPKQDSRRKVTVEQEEEIKQDLDSGGSTSEVAKKHGVSKGRISQLKKASKTPQKSEPDSVGLEDREMEELIAEGEEHLRQALVCFFPFEDEVAETAVNDILGSWFQL
jgi:ParB-like chromosome segregation protein Spo0J